MKIAIVGFLSALLGALVGGFAVYVLFERWGSPTPVEGGRLQVTELTLVDELKRPAAGLSVTDNEIALKFLRLIRRSRRS